MGRSQRNKGKKGEREAKALLADRDYEVLADTSAGLSTDDLVVRCPQGHILSVEVKNHKILNLPAFLNQARTNAKKLDWMLMCKIDQTSSWLIMRKNHSPVIWHSKEKLI